MGEEKELGKQKEKRERGREGGGEEKEEGSIEEKEEAVNKGDENKKCSFQETKICKGFL